MPLETTPESPVPVRTVLRLVGEWVGRLGRVWVEGQIAELNKRGNAVFLTLRDPVAAVSVRVVCPRQVFENAEPAAANGARVVGWVKPDFSMARGSFTLSAIELRAVGIIAGGGDSIEALLPFSDEYLIRAVASCRTPVVSAIGHEQDVPLLDLVADVRASTPTDAARRVVPDISEQIVIISELRSRARRQLAGRLDREAAWLKDIRSRPILASPAAELDRRHEQVLALAERARRCFGSGLDRAQADLAHTRALLIALSPAATLRRGYAIVQRADSTVVRSARDVARSEPLLIRLASDQINVTVSD